VAATANVEMQERRARADLQAAAMTYCSALQRLLQVNEYLDGSVLLAGGQLDDLIRMVVD
jgi:hypothetical protein